MVTLGENQITGVSGIGWEPAGSFALLVQAQPATDSANASTTQKRDEQAG